MIRFKRIVIVAFGDSLTVGFQSPSIESPWPEETPYTDLLRVSLIDYLEREGLSQNVNVDIYNKGVNGDLTTSMLIRFRRDVIDLNPNYAIILGGSNDLGWGVPPKEVFRNLKRMYDDAKSIGIQPIACTVPSVLGFDLQITPRLILNGLIRQACQRNSMVYADLFKSTSDNQTGRLLEKYSNDGLHLNTEGYRKIAETIFRAFENTILEAFKNG